MKINYNFFEKFIHKFTLGNKYFLEISFLVEKFFFINKNEVYVNDEKNIFITGMARSGTTILLNSLYNSNKYSSLTYKNIPLIMMPNIFGYIRKFSKEKNIKSIPRAHNDGINISLNSPEAFEEIFWKTFETNKNKSKLFTQYIYLIKNSLHGKPYLSKNNHNYKRLRLIKQIFPQSGVAIVFRNPIDSCISSLSKHLFFNDLSKKDKFIKEYFMYTKHTEFGPCYKPFKKNMDFPDTHFINHWFEQWISIYEKIITQKKFVDIFVCYDFFKSISYKKKISSYFDIDIEYFSDFKIKSSESRSHFFKLVDKKLYKKSMFIYSKLIELSK